MGYGKQTEHISGGLNDTFQTTGRQGDFRPNHRRVMCNYPKKKFDINLKVEGMSYKFWNFLIDQNATITKIKRNKIYFSQKKNSKIKIKKKKLEK